MADDRHMFRDEPPGEAVHVINVVPELTDYDKGKIVYVSLYTDRSITHEELADKYDVTRKQVAEIIDYYEEIKPTFPALEPTLLEVFDE